MENREKEKDRSKIVNKIINLSWMSVFFSENKCTNPLTFSLLIFLCNFSFYPLSLVPNTELGIVRDYTYHRLISYQTHKFLWFFHAEEGERRREVGLKIISEKELDFWISFKVWLCLTQWNKRRGKKCLNWFRICSIMPVLAILITLFQVFCIAIIASSAWILCLVVYWYH